MLGKGFIRLFEHPKTVWGASFEVYRDGEDHRTRTTEEFYPLFTTSVDATGIE